MKVSILGKEDFIRFIGDFKPKEMNKIFYISILDPEFKEPLHKELSNYKTFWFWDVPEKIGNYNPISQNQAQDIYNFIQSNNDKRLCIVHCTAGVSRSGAVGTFIHNQYGNPLIDFSAENPFILPNELVLNLLQNIK